MKTILTAGLIHPTGFLPAARRASLIATIIAATMGVEADVPPLSVRFLSITTAVGNPFADRSGTPRPVRLKMSGPRSGAKCFRYLPTARF